jgi:hypothetical protein
MKDTFDLTKFLKENKTFENFNPLLSESLKKDKTPLNENTLRDKIREMVLAELDGGEDYELEDRKQEYGINPEMDDLDIDIEDDLYEAKKKKKDEEVEDAEDIEDVELPNPDEFTTPEESAPEDELSTAASYATGDSKELINNLNLEHLLYEIKDGLNLKLFSLQENDIVDGHIETNDNIVDFVFNNNLTENQILILDNIINSHVPILDYKIPIYFKINNSIDDPQNIDYDIMGYHKKRTINKGELNTIEYYKNYIFSSDTYSDLVVRESRVYIKDTIGVVIYRDLSIEWFLNDDTVGVTKVFRKFYTPEAALQEGIDRRSNIINTAKSALLKGLKDVYGEPINQQYAFDFLLGISAQINYFKEGYTQPLKEAVNNSTKAYMSPAIKASVYNELNF